MYQSTPGRLLCSFLLLLILQFSASAQVSIELSQGGNQIGGPQEIAGSTGTNYKFDHGAYYLIYSAKKGDIPVFNGYSGKYYILNPWRRKHRKIIRKHTDEVKWSRRYYFRSVLCFSGTEEYVIQKTDGGQWFLSPRPGVLSSQQRAGYPQTLAPDQLDFIDAARASSSYADYVITFDAADNNIHIQRRKRNYKWHTINKRASYMDRLRLKVNDLVQVRVVNANLLSDSFRLKYSFDNLNQEGQDKFIESLKKIDTEGLNKAIARNEARKSGGRGPSSEMPEDSSSTKSTGVIISEHLDTLLYEFNEVYREAKSLPVTPDQLELRQRLIELYEERWDLSDYINLSDNSANNQVLREALAADNLEAKEKAAALDNAKQIQNLFDIMTSARPSAFAPIQMQDADRLNLTILRGETELNPTPYRFYSRGGFKIDFSAGFAVTGLGDNEYFYSSVRQETVQVSTVESEGTTTVTQRIDKYGTIQEEQSRPRYGATALAHFYTRLGWKVNGALTIGGLVVDEKFNLLAGGSILLGQQQRLALSGGVAIGEVERLKPGYNVGSEYLDSGASLNGDVNFTEDRIMCSWFAGFTYNLGITGNRTSQLINL